MMYLKICLFISQPLLELTKTKLKGTDYVFTWKPKGVYNFKLTPLHTVFFHSITPSEYSMEITFDKDPLAFRTQQLLKQN